KVVGLPSGSYVVSFYPGSGENYITQYWENQIDSASAKPIPVSLGEKVPNIDATLAVGGQITGVVTDASTHRPAAEIEVYAYGPIGSEEGSRAYTYTNANGEYTLSGLPTGSYKIEYGDEYAEYFLGEGSSKYLTQFYSGKASEAAADPVAVTQKSTTTGINVALVPRVPFNTAPPVASGTPAVGQRLACSRGSWTGQLTMYFTYQWRRDGSAISGAAGNSYAVQSSDQGHALSCEVNARNARGHVSATSNSLSVPAAVVPPPPPPPPLPTPVIALAHVSTLTATRGALHVTLSCKQAQTLCAGTVEVVERVVVKVRVGHRLLTRRRNLVLAHGPYTLTGGHSTRVLLRLTKVGKRTLLRARHHRVAAVILASVRGGKSIGEVASLSLRR
ncbi:MAG TPA: carboxypeptidase regulatory-like domain-containing protein, partial [Solirubrobacteraceae bacterium]|nr:carboxypeptidase regulatory-like domain-containing protein [Solirubrobacteraceae bacterium]